MYLLSCGSFLHESISMEDQVLAKHRFIQYISTYSLTLQFTCTAMFSVTTHSLQMITCQLLSTSRSLWGQCTRTWMHTETKYQSTKRPVPLYRMFSDRYNKPDYLVQSRLEHRASNLLDANPTYKTNQPPSNNVDKTVSMKSNITGIPLYRSVHLTRYHS
jgi:hypothetical protein